MYTPNELQKTVFFDLETASTYSTLNELCAANPKMGELWKKRCDYLRARFEENREMSDSELYEAKAALTPEFSRIICASFGRVNFTESEVLEGISTVFTKFIGYKFSGHNIKRFDVPMMCKRLLMSGRTLPKGLLITNLKPWEMPFIDTSEIWSFGAWQEGFASLELLATSLGIDTPKDDIRGEDVGKVFWQDGDIDRITKYCEKDVLACVQVILKLSNLHLVEEEQL